MDGRGRLAQSLNWIARLRARPPTAAPRRARARVAHHCDEPMLRRLRSGCCTAAGSGSMRIRLPRGAGIAAATALIVLGEPRLRRRQGRPCAGRSSRFWRTRATQAANAAGFRIASIALAGQQPADPGGGARHRRRHRHAPRCCSSTPTRRASGSRPIPGSPTPPCSSSIPASCRSDQGARGLRALAEGRPGLRHRRRRHRARAVRRRRSCRGCRWWSAAAPRRGPRISSRCSTAIPRCATRCAPRSWSASGAGTCG